LDLQTEKTIGENQYCGSGINIKIKKFNSGTGKARYQHPAGRVGGRIGLSHTHSFPRKFIFQLFYNTISFKN
jgi:hypothetical protein